MKRDPGIIARIDETCNTCASTHSIDDVVDHLEEELIELLLAIKRLKRGKGSLEDVIEESLDCSYEIQTFLTALRFNKIPKEIIDNIDLAKISKFESMLRVESKTGITKRYQKFATRVAEWREII